MTSSASIFIFQKYLCPWVIIKSKNQPSIQQVLMLNLILSACFLFSHLNLMEMYPGSFRWALSLLKLPRFLKIVILLNTYNTI